MPVPQVKNYAYTTLITRASYLAGVIILAHTLKKQGSRYPLLVYYTKSLERDAVRVLELQATKLNLILKPVDFLLPPSNVEVHLIAERFGDTWTKLRVFDCIEYDAVCYLDADMAIYRNMDEIFSHAERLPQDWLAANHACVCNLERDAWAPEDWKPENCAYTPVEHPGALTHPTQQSPDSRPTWHLLNGGMFLYHPSRDLWNDMINYFNKSDKLGTYKFPDQDFLADYFRNRWISLGWQYNALKTMRYWHPNIWRDEEVRCLHYIVDKPWAKHVVNGVAGYRGNDGETHTWWWNEFDDWRRAREEDGDTEVLELIGKGAHMATKDGSENEHADMKAISSSVQAFAKNKIPEKMKVNAVTPKNDENGLPRPGDDSLRPRILGERGHGPVANGFGKQ